MDYLHNSKHLPTAGFAKGPVPEDAGGERVDLFPEPFQKCGFAFFGAAARGVIEFLFEIGVVRDGKIFVVPMREESDGRLVADGSGLGIGDEHHECATTLHTVENSFGGKILFVNVDRHDGKG